MSSKSNARLPARAVDLDADGVLAAVGEAGGLEDAERAAAELRQERRGVVHGDLAPAGAGRAGQSGVLARQRPLVDEGAQAAGDPGDRVAGDELGEVDDVGADVAERARACLGLVQPPRQRRLRVDDPVLEVLRPDVVQRAEPALGHELAGQRDGRDPAVGEARPSSARRWPRPSRRRRPSPRPPRRCWPAASRTARACRPRARRSRSRRGCRPGCTRRPGRCRRGRPGPATTSRSTPSPAGRPPRRRAAASRPASAVIRRRSGRSKNRGALRQACEWAAPMKA